MTLDRQQSQFVDELLNGSSHIILTGKAGTGKSVSLCHGVKAAQASGMDVIVMAPTAMAASIHRDAGLDSGTIHHALRWNPVREPLPRKLLAVSGLEKDWSAKPDQNRILIVDETSMVGLWLFEILGRDLGEGKVPDNRPFDGRRVVLVGDWAQLPPVVGPTEASIAKAIPELNKYGPMDGCVFYHQMFRHNPPTAILLEESHRANSAWFDSLNLLRDCTKRTRLSDFGINPKSHRESSMTDAVHMCYRRTTAYNRNNECLAKLPGRSHNVMLRDGDTQLKEGCDVIVTANRAHGDYINGSRAEFTGMTEEGLMVLDDEAEIKLLADGNWSRHKSYNADIPVDEAKAHEGRETAKRMLMKYHDIIEPEAQRWLESVITEETGQIAQKLATGAIRFQPYYPVLPGYALTVHKAQGCTLGAVVIEEDVFWNIAPERLPYVALSRVHGAENVALNEFTAGQVRIRPDHNYTGMFGRITSWRK